ncbi:MAG: glycosyltransferase, partial [Candidatus Omnitrophica bacterium]|nr:glycosyltransferase [Candidatus Omnitrophota bacterium]
MSKDGVLSRIGTVGILNGVPAKWRYVTDYSQKEDSKLSLQSRLGLEQGRQKKIIFMVGRLGVQKGVSLIIDSREQIKELLRDFPHTELIIGGKPENGWGESLTELKRELEMEFPSRVRIMLEFLPEDLVESIFRAADINLFPSLFEPAGSLYKAAVNMIITVARWTGGLTESAVSIIKNKGNAVVFEDYTPDAFMAAFRQTLELTVNEDSWQAIQMSAPGTVKTWDAQFMEYAKVIAEAREAKGIKSVVSSPIQDSAKLRAPSETFSESKKRKLNELINKKNRLVDKIVDKIVYEDAKSFVWSQIADEFGGFGGFGDLGDGWHVLRYDNPEYWEKFSPLYNYEEGDRRARVKLDSFLHGKISDSLLIDDNYLGQFLDLDGIKEDLTELRNIISEIKKLKALQGSDTNIEEKHKKIKFTFRGMESIDSIPADRDKYGNKAVNLHRLIKLGLPVPPGYVISTEYLKAKKRIPIEMFRLANRKLEEQTGKRFGDANNPLYLAARSSSAYSMPGILHTELQVEDEKQLIKAIKKVKDSWNSSAAKKYRDRNSIQAEGMGIIIQVMVHGDKNENSGAGVFFTRDPLIGVNKLTGRFAIKATGNDIVGRKNIKTEPIEKLRSKFPDIYNELGRGKDGLEKKFRAAQEVEFIIEDGKLWILQTRDAVLSPEAQTKAAIDMAKEGIIAQLEMLVKIEKASAFQKEKQVYKIRKGVKLKAIAKGTPSSFGAAQGQVAFSLKKAKELKSQGKEVILIAFEKPEEIEEAIVNGLISGIVTQYGHEALHESVLARSQAVPLIDGMGDAEVKRGILQVGEYVLKEGDLIV